MTVRETVSTPRLFRIRGDFDASAALHLRDELDWATPRPVRLDFSQASCGREALALLGVNLMVLHRSGRQVFVRGLEDDARDFLLHFGIAICKDGWAAFLLHGERLPLD
jgi:hypothetical protein